MPICQVHNCEMKQIPAGVSKKTGKPYDAFYACQIQDCKYRPPKENQPLPLKKKEETDWGSIGKQKALCGMVNGMLSAGIDPKVIPLMDLNAIFNKIQTLSGVPAVVPPAVSKASPKVISDDVEEANQAIESALADNGYGQPE